MGADFFQDLINEVVRMMNAHRHLFVAFGNKIYASFAVIMLAWFGIQSALSRHFSVERFAKLILTISWGFAMLRFYSTPVPGWGYSFSDLFVEQANHLAGFLNNAIANDVKAELIKMYNGFGNPGIGILKNLGDAVFWVFGAVLVIAAFCCVQVVIAFGYIAMAVCILLGPIFLPFFIVPDLEWVAWGWIRATIQYSFYQVVGSAFVYVLGGLLITWTKKASSTLSEGQVMALPLPLILILVTFVYGILKVPSLCNSIWSGKSGESAGLGDLVGKLTGGR